MFTATWLYKRLPLLPPAASSTRLQEKTLLKSRSPKQTLKTQLGDMLLQYTHPDEISKEKEKRMSTPTLEVALAPTLAKTSDITGTVQRQ